MFGGRPTRHTLENGLEDSSSTSGDSKSGDTAKGHNLIIIKLILCESQTVKQEEEEHKLDDIGKDNSGKLISGEKYSFRSDS